MTSKNAQKDRFLQKYSICAFLTNNYAVKQGGLFDKRQKLLVD